MSLIKTNIQYGQVVKNSETLMYTYQKTERVKNIIARIENNQVRIKCPPSISKDMLNYFVYQNFEKFIEFINKKSKLSLINLDENKISLRGNPYQLIIKLINTGHEKYEIINNKIYLFIRDENHKKKIVAKLLHEQGNDILIKRAKQLANIFFKAFHIQPEKISTKWYESKWGQCNYTKREITLAIQLYMLNDSIIDYVIIHELCHLIYPNHSNDFWSLVAKLYPKYKYIKEKLKFEC